MAIQSMGSRYTIKLDTEHRQYFNALIQGSEHRTASDAIRALIRQAYLARIMQQTDCRTKAKGE